MSLLSKISDNTDNEFNIAINVLVTQQSLLIFKMHLSTVYTQVTGRKHTVLKKRAKGEGK